MTPSNSDDRAARRDERQERSERWARPERGRDEGRGRGERRGFSVEDRRESGQRREGRDGGRRGNDGYRQGDRNDSRRGERSSRWDDGRDRQRSGQRRDDRRSDRWGTDAGRGDYSDSGDRGRRNDDRGYGRRDERSSRRDDARGERRGYGDDRRRDSRDRRDFGRNDDRRRGDSQGRGERRGDGWQERRGGRPERFDRRQGDDRRSEQRGPSSERDGSAVTRGPRSWDRRPDDAGKRPQRAPEPELPEEITGRELDRAVRQQLRTLSKENAEGVARHLVAAAELLDLDEEKALAHAQHAVMRASRVPAAREALGLVLYRMGDYAEALREFRTARRLSGSDHLLPYMVDCERGLGRFERALELANSPEAQRLSESDNIELAIVVSGVRRDMGQSRAAVVGLRIPALTKATTQPWAARLFYAYADALLDIDETDEAREWFAKAAMADQNGETDADDRVAEIDGIVMEDLTPEDEQQVDERLANIDLSKPFGTPPTEQE